MVKIVIPTSDKQGEYLSGHFGRAPYFAWFSIEDGSIIDKGIVPNDSEHFGGIGLPPERIAHLGPSAVITTGMGIKAINIFQQMNVAVLQAKSQRADENIDLFVQGELVELTEGCLHAREH